MAGLAVDEGSGNGKRSDQRQPAAADSQRARQLGGELAAVRSAAPVADLDQAVVVIDDDGDLDSTVVFSSGDLVTVAASRARALERHMRQSHQCPGR